MVIQTLGWREGTSDRLSPATTVSGDEISGTTSCHTTSEMRRVAAGRAPVTAASRAAVSGGHL
jgi:hypothetical protein